MATIRLDNKGVSTNDSLSNSGNIAAGDTEYSVLVNMTGSAVKVQFDTSDQVEIYLVENSLSASGGSVETLLDGRLGSQHIVVPAGAGVTLRGNNNDTATHGFNLAANGITAMHGTSTQENRDIMWTRNDVAVAS